MWATTTSDELGLENTVRRVPGSEPGSVSWPSALAAVLATVPAVLALFIIRVDGVNVAYSDQWALIPYIDREYPGTLSLADLFAQHNEHRMFFPRIAFLILFNSFALQ